MARVVESRYTDPVNNLPGWYVLVAGTRSEVLGEEGRRLAQREARENGYDPERYDRGNFPGKSDGEYTMTYRFRSTSITGGL